MWAISIRTLQTVDCCMYVCIPRGCPLNTGFTVVHFEGDRMENR